MKSLFSGPKRVALIGLAAALPSASQARPAGPSPLPTQAPAVVRSHESRAHAELPRSIAWHAATERPATSFLGPDWRAAIDTATGVPSRLWGPGLSVPGSIASPDVALAFARAFLAAHLAALAPGSSVDDFYLVANDLDAGQRTVAFTQHHGGIAVLGGQLSLRFKNDRLFLISSQAVPVSGVPRRIATSLQAPALREAAVRWITDDVAPATASTAPLAPPVYLAVPGDDGTTELRLVHAVVVATSEVRTPASASLADRFEVFVDAATGEPLARRSQLRRASSTLMFNAPVTHAGTGGSRMDYPAGLLSVTVDSTSAETSAAGVVQLATAPAQLAVGVVGRFVEVITAAGDQFAQTLTATDGSVLTVDKRDDEIADAQVSAYVHANLVKDWARRVTNGNMAWLDEKLVVNANQPNVCNAFYDGATETLNFFQAGSYQNVACQNTALVADVVHHEFGHALHDHAIIPGAGLFDYSLSEGIGDYVAATMSNDPRMGRGFFADFPDEPMRNLDDVDHVLPDDIDYDVHWNGLIFAGAMWDLRKALVAGAGSDGALVADRLLYQGIRRATDIPSTYLEVLAADGDDGNLVNGTPHGCEITAAFAPHGLVPEGAYGTAGVQRPTIEGSTFVVQVRPSACPGTAITSLVIESRRRGVDGTDKTTPLEASSSTPDADGFVRHEAAMPYVPDGGILEYRVTAELAGGGVVHFPENPADPYYDLLVGEATPVFCDNLDGASYPKGFTHKLVAGDQGYGADEWTWGSPIGGAYNGDPLTAYSGDKILGTDLGGSNSEGWYAPSRSSRMSTPVLELGTLDPNTRVHLQYRRWVALGAGDRAEIEANDHAVWSSLPPAAGAPIHRDREWKLQDVDVTDQVAPDGKLRIDFTIIADAAREGGGWNIDDVCVVTAPAPTCTTADCSTAPADPGDSGGCCDSGTGSARWPSGALLSLAVLLGIRRRRA